MAGILTDNLLYGYPFNPTIKERFFRYQPAYWRTLTRESDEYRFYAEKSPPFYAMQRSKLIQKSA